VDFIDGWCFVLEKRGGLSVAFPMGISKKRGLRFIDLIDVKSQ